MSNKFLMTHFRFHFFYIALILFLGYQYHEQKELLKISYGSLNNINEQLKNDSEIIENNNISLAEAIDRIVQIAPKLQSLMAQKYPVEAAATHSLKLLKKYKETFVDYCGGWDSVQNSIKQPMSTSQTSSFFNDSRLNELKTSLSILSIALCNIQDSLCKTLIIKRLQLPLLLKNDIYWNQLKNKTHGTAYSEILRIINLIQSDECVILNFNLDKISDGPPLRFNNYKIVFAPKKAIWLEGESFEGDIYITPYSSLNYAHKGLSLSVNGVNIPISDDIVHYVSPPQSIGKKTLDATISLKNNATGEVATTSSKFNYEVLPSCSRNCQ